MKPLVRRLRIAPGFDYAVTFTRGLFDPANPLLADTLGRGPGGVPPRAAVYVDAGLAAARPELRAEIAAYARARGLTLVRPPRVVPGGERAKHGPALALRVARELLAARLDRQSFVLAVGGGAMLDAVGLGAALTHRGVRLIRAPSTTLAQNDAGIGVKNGVNHQGQKNALGVFAPPWAVLNDLDLLDSLPDDVWIAGHAEAFKVAMIRDAVFFDTLCRDARRLRARDPAAQARAVIRCAELHLRHIGASGDPFELGAARPLDYGHWSAHQLERMTGCALAHGPAVAIGIALDAAYAARIGWLDPRVAARLARGLRAVGFRLDHPALTRRRPDGALMLFDGLDAFREHLGGELTLTLPVAAGRAREVHTIDRAAMEACVRALSVPPRVRGATPASTWRKRPC
jgi:3-dehydroquinate synthase